MKRLFDPQPAGKTVISVRELGRTRRFVLDGREKWTLGHEIKESRKNKDIAPNTPDIPLRSEIASRKHGEFLCLDGQLYYVDRDNYNGTYYNGEKIKKGLNGSAIPVLLKDGDVLRIDAPDLNDPDSRHVIITVTIRD